MDLDAPTLSHPPLEYPLELQHPFINCQRHSVPPKPPLEEPTIPTHKSRVGLGAVYPKTTNMRRSFSSLTFIKIG